LILSKIKDQELKTILTLCYESAFRISEVTSLERKQIDFKSNIIFLPSKKTKGNKSRPVPISKNTADMLKNLPPRIDGKVFSHKQSHYRYAFEIICQRARIDNLTFHDLRRTAATRMIMKGVDTFRVAQILGHSGLEMTRRYSIFKTEDLTAAFEMSLSV
jgi:integrase